MSGISCLFLGVRSWEALFWVDGHLQRRTERAEGDEFPSLLLSVVTLSQVYTLFTNGMVQKHANIPHYGFKLG